MMPREHGSWAVLAAPILVGLAAAGGAPVLVALLFCVAALAGFLLRVPLQSLLSPRPAPGARAWLTGEALVAAAAGLALLLGYGRWGLIGFALPAGALLAYNLRANLARETFSYANEVVGIVGLCLGAPAAYYAARGAFSAAAWTAWALSALYFICPVFHVKTAAHQHRGAPDSARMARASLVYHALALAAVFAAVLVGRVHGLTLLPFAAALDKSRRRARMGPGKVNFRKIGFEEVGYSTLFVLATSAGFLLDRRLH